MCTTGVKEFSESAKAAQREANKRWNEEARRAQETNISGKAMEQFEGGMRSTQGVGNVILAEVDRWGDAILNRKKPEEQAATETASANYSKSSSEKSSQTKSKAKSETGKGTGGSKSQFYAKK